MPPTLETALILASQGWYLLPCYGVSQNVCLCPQGPSCDQGAGKHPHRLAVPHGLLDASTDEHTIRRWFTSYPDANVAVALTLSGMIALDVDAYKGDRERLEALETLYGPLPDTRIQQSGSGEGYHLLFNAPGFPVKGNLGDITVRGRNYIVIAPSNHVSGGQYTWLNDAPIASLPDAWLEALRRPESVGEVGIPQDEPDWLKSIPQETRLASMVQWLQVQDPEVKGKSSSGHTWNVLRGAVRGFGIRDADIAHEALKAFNNRCDPPWSGDRFAEKVRKAYLEAETPEWGSSLMPRDVLLDSIGLGPKAKVPVAPDSDAALLQQALIDVNASIGTIITNPEIGLLFERSDSLFTRDYPETQWLVWSLITQGGVGGIATEPKSAKTWLATELAIAVATGTDACGQFKTNRARVAYFYAEDQAVSIRNRLRALIKGRGVGPDALDLLHVQPRGRNLNVTKPADLALLVASCRKLGDVKLLVLDPLRDIHTGKENEADEMSTVMKHLRVVSNLVGCSVCFVHHSAKSGADSGKRRGGQKMRGSSVIHGSVDFGIYLSDLKGDAETTFTNRVESEVKGARGAGFFSLTLNIEDGADGTAERAAWSYAKIEAAVGSKSTPGENMEARCREVLDVLGVHFKPMSGREIRDRMKGRMELVQAACHEAERRGWIGQAPGRVAGYILTDEGKRVFTGVADEQATYTRAVKVDENTQKLSFLEKLVTVGQP